MRIGLKSAAIAVALAFNPLTAGAAGLGKISVLSTLGQPLKAEVDISASRDEVPTLAARLAPADAFKQQGIAYGAALSGIRLVIEKRPSGQPYVRITGDRPLNEPFLEILVELSWGSGRLVREYTFLLDPPADLTQKAVAIPVAPPEVKAEAKVEAQPEAKVAVAEPEKKPAPSAAVAAEARPEPKKAAAEAGEREVKRGDTLGKIAADLKPEGVNLDQMLVALFRSNQDAFDGENMNRLRAGKILKLPERADILAVDATDARQIVVAQSADFSAYRKKLAAVVAAAPAKEEAPQQAVAGKIAPKVEDKAPPAPAGKDKLEVSRTEAAKDAKGAAGAKARISALEEDLVARDRALKEANSRVAELEKNLADLKKLVELKSQSGAKMQEQAGKPAVPEAKKPEAAPAKPAEAPKVAAPPPPVAAAPAAPPTAPAAAAAKPDEAKPAEAAKPAKPATTGKPPAPAKKPAPPPEPTFIEAYGGMLAMAGAALVTGLLGFLGFTAIRKKRRAKAEAEAESGALTGTDLSANSVFGSTGGQSVDTGGAMHTDFGQAAGGHDEGVDPVAEADVYMAYGRDAQAEEILIEALKTEPSRHTIHVKLLEIYSARKSVRQFETLAMDLKGQTGGSGADWEKAAAMGRALDPSNPLYSPDGAESAHVAPAAAPAAPAAPAVPIAPAAAAAASLASTVIFAPGASEKMQATVTMPGQLAQMAAAAEATTPQEAASLDFDLDLGGPITEQPAAAEAPAAAPASMDFDLDLGSPAGAGEPAAAAPVPATLDVDLGLSAPIAEPAADAGIDFAMDLGTAPAAPPVAVPAAEAEPSAGGIDFDFGAGEPAAGTAAPVTEAPSPAIDLSSISLDLGEPMATTQPAAAGPADSPEVATKLELAQAYEEMGDKDGARELLQEVLKEGGPSQQETARARLAKL